MEEHPGRDHGEGARGERAGNAAFRRLLMDWAEESNHDFLSSTRPFCHRVIRQCDLFNQARRDQLVKGA